MASEASRWVFDVVLFESARMGATFTSRTYNSFVLVQLEADVRAAEVPRCYARERGLLL